MFIDVSKLPQNSIAEGPQDWGDAWSRLAGASDDTQKIIENFNAGTDALEEAYDRRIRSIEQITGTSLPNPLRTASEREKGLAHLQTGMIPIGELMPELRQEEEAEFDRKARALAERYPQVNAVLATGIEEQRNQVMRDTQAEASRAAQSYALGPVGRFTAQLVGGLKGTARDPYQWGMATFGAGPSAAKTVAGRIGQTMATEFLVNGGSELVLQVASQERKREAGLDHGVNDVLANVGVAGVFGSLFGGTVQGGAELARILKLGEGGAEQAARIIEGRPEPGDVEAFAAAAGIELGDDTKAQLARSFEERILDDIMVPENATPDDITLMRAALRHAEDPDNFPEPELIERALADSSQAGGRTLSADEYERIYGGEPDAVDAYRDSILAQPDLVEQTKPRSPWDDFVASRPDALAVVAGPDPVARARELAEEARLANIELENSIFGVEIAERYRRLLRQENSSSPSISDKAAAERAELERALTPEQEELLFNSPYETDPEYWRDVSATLSEHMVDDPKDLGLNLVLAARNFRADVPWEAASRSERMAAIAVHTVGADAQRLGLSLDDLMRQMEGAARARYPDLDDAEFMIRTIRDALSGAVVRSNPPTTAPIALADADPVRGQTIRPQGAAEPLDDAAMVKAEELAGEILDPVPDETGRPRTLYDLVALEDGDGNISLVSTREALEVADIPNFHADLLEACRL